MRGVVGAARPPAYDDLAQLSATTAVFAETLRLYPPAWVVGRRLTAPTVLGGWPVPARSVCLASQWVLHRDPRCWDDPLGFRPDRWLTAAGTFDEAAPGQPPGAWFPFGLGRRACVGERFAWAEGVLVLATLASRWTARTVPGHRVAVAPAATLRPAGGLPMRLSRTQSADQ